MFIGIDIGNNDFNATICGFLRIFTQSNLVELRPEHVTKARILQIWKMTAPGIYWVQNAWSYTNGVSEAEHHEYIAKYLTSINESQFFIEAECLDRIVKDNKGKFHYIDTNSGRIGSS